MKVQAQLVDTLRSVPLPGLVEYLVQGSYYIPYITGETGVRKPAGVLAHTHADATTSTAGFMSSTDKTKLDGIPNGDQIVSGSAGYASTLIGAADAASNLTKSGFYYNTGTDKLGTLNDHLIHVNHPGNAAYWWQMAIPYGGAARPMMRRNINGSVESWTAIATESYVGGQLAGYATTASIAANYVPFARTLVIFGTAGRVNVIGGTGSSTQNLAENRSWTVDLAASGVSAGTYRSVTVDAYGRVTAGTNPTTLAGYGITDAMSQATADGRYVSQSSANLISAAHTFTSVNLTLPSLYYQTPNINNDVFQSYYPIGGNGTNPTRANLRVWDGSSVMTLALRGDTGNLEWRGNIVATQNWVSSQGYVTGGPFLSTSGGTMTGNIAFSPDGTGLILNGGAMVYKRAGGGLTFKRHSSETDPVVESNDGSSRWTVWHAGNITPVPTSRNLSFSANDGLNVSGTPISDLSGDRIVTFGITGISAAKITSGTLPVGRGGTGLTSVGSNGQVLMSNGSAMYWAGIFSGSGSSGYYAIFTGGASVGNGRLFNSGGSVVVSTTGGMGNNSSSELLHINGGFAAYGDCAIRSANGASFTFNVWRNMAIGDSVNDAHGTLLIHDGLLTGDIDGNCLFEARSTSKASAPFPRMTTAQFNNISKSTDRMFAWDWEDQGLIWWDGSRKCGIRYNGSKYQGWTGTGWGDLH